YYAVISHMDEQIGRILEALEGSGRADNTIVMFTSDHGLAIGGHGLRGKQNMYEHTTGVPLVIRGPGVLEGRRSNAQCYLRALFPTACDLAGIRIPAAVEGRSLAPILKGGTEAVYSETFGHFGDSQRMIRTNRWKLIWYPKIRRYQLFDLVNDPDELADLSAAPGQADVVAELRAKLKSWQVKVGDPLATTH
ncbi:MAG: sulfatase-like hydrolase/transferase, partial [bacterium]|nr:sulfatase-like hydrolase/transferase [bacterium]